MQAQMEWNERQYVAFNQSNDQSSLKRADSIDLITQPKPKQAEFVKPKPPLPKDEPSQTAKKQTVKVRIPGKNPGDASMFVNAKQAHRMLIMREKRVKKFVKLQNAQQVDAQKLGK